MTPKRRPLRALEVGKKVNRKQRKIAMSKVEELKDVIAKLEANLVAATNKATALQAERRRIAFSACNGDGHARALLDGLNTDSTVAGLEIENAKAAIDEGRWKLFEAEREEERAAKREHALKVRELIKVIEPSGPRLAMAVQELCERIRLFNKGLDDLRGLGVPVANGRLVALALTRTLFAKLREVGILVDAIPPGLRSEPAFLVRAYLEAPTKWVADTLGETDDEPVAANVAEVA
jgi:hypothetical protein